jgi:DNA polymerase-1
MVMMKKVLLIDGDLLLHRFSNSNETVYQWDEVTTSQVLNLEQAYHDLTSMIDEIKEATHCDDYLLCLSPDQPCFRYDVLPSYKHNRQNKPKPPLLKPLKERAIETLPCKTKPKLEADDVLGIMSTMKPGQYIIASLDKDLNQIPGSHYNWKKDDLYEVSQEEADLFFYTQVLTGDSVDGYSGCPNIGKKKAEYILKNADEYWPAIVSTYESKGLTEDDALVQARVARILRNCDYDFKKKEVVLWIP